MKMRTGILPVNQMLARWKTDVAKGCSLCSFGKAEGEEEDTLHLLCRCQDPEVRATRRTMVESLRQTLMSQRSNFKGDIFDNIFELKSICYRQDGQDQTAEDLLGEEAWRRILGDTQTSWNDILENTMAQSRGGRQTWLPKKISNIIDRTIHS